MSYAECNPIERQYEKITVVKKPQHCVTPVTSERSIDRCTPHYWVSVDKEATLLIPGCNLVQCKVSFDWIISGYLVTGTQNKLRIRQTTWNRLLGHACQSEKLPQPIAFDREQNILNILTWSYLFNSASEFPFVQTTLCYLSLYFTWKLKYFKHINNEYNRTKYSPLCRQQITCNLVIFPLNLGYGIDVGTLRV